DTATKQRFCERLMQKYGKPNSIRPKNFFPRLDVITVYALTVERMTGKERLLPELSEQWPTKDRTKKTNVRQMRHRRTRFASTVLRGTARSCLGPTHPVNVSAKAAHDPGCVKTLRLE